MAAHIPRSRIPEKMPSPEEPAVERGTKRTRTAEAGIAGRRVEARPKSSVEIGLDRIFNLYYNHNEGAFLESLKTFFAKDEMPERDVEEACKCIKGFIKQVGKNPITSALEKMTDEFDRAKKIKRPTAIQKMRKAFAFAFYNGPPLIKGGVSLAKTRDTTRHTDTFLRSEDASALRQVSGATYRDLTAVPIASPERANKLVSTAIQREARTPGWSISAFLAKLPEIERDGFRKNVNSLDLTDLPITPSLLREIRTYFPKLRVLNLVECRLDGPSLNEVARFRHLRDLNLQGNKNIPPGFLQTLAQSVPHLEVLALGWCDLSPDSLAELPRFTKLKTLDLSGNRNSTPGFLQTLAQSAPNLEVLALRWCALSPDSLAELPRFTKLRNLNLLANLNVTADFLRTLAQAAPNLEVLNLRRCNLNPDSLAELPRFTKLKTLDLAGNGSITPTFLQALATSAPDLEVLALNEGCDLHPDSLAELPRFTKLKTLNLAGNRNSTPGFLQTLAQSAPNLEVLNLTGCDLHPDSLAELPRLTKLKTLDLADNRNSTPRFLQGLATSAPNLEVLALDGCDLHRDSLAELLRFTKLRDLNLLANLNVTADFLRALAQSAPNLEVLDLGGDSLSRDSLAELLRFTKLRNLNLSANLNVTADFLRALAQSAPNLEVLYLASCGLDAATRAELSRFFPKARVVI